MSTPLTPNLSNLLQMAPMENAGTLGPPAQPQPEQDFGPDNRDLPKPLQAALKKLVGKFQAEDKYARRQEVIEARRQRFYDRGDQYIYFNQQSWVFMPVSGGGSVQVGSDAVDMPRYTDVYNIFHGYLRSIVAVLTQNPPGVNFEPDDPTKSVDITAAQTAEKFKHVIDRANDRKAIQTEIARFFCTDDRVVIYTKMEADADRFGTKEDGSPVSMPVLEVNGVLESKVPITARSQKEFPYLFLSDELHVDYAKEIYEWAAETIKPGPSGTGESAYERVARLGTLQGTRAMYQTGDAYADLVTRHRCWLRPSAFREAPKGVDGQLKQIFPDGCRVIFSGDGYCGSYNESMDDCLTVGHAQPGDGQARPSWLKPLVPIQDAYNNYTNMRREYHDYGIPVTYMETEGNDIEALRDQISEPGNHVGITRPGGITRVQDMFYAPAALSPPADLVQAQIDLRDQLSQFVTAVFPALFGGDTKQNDTLGGIAIQRDQAMGNMGVAWGALQELYSKAYKQGVALAAEEAADSDMLNVSLPGRRGTTKTDVIKMADLKTGKFHCFPDTDSSFPETWSAKRQAFQQFMLAAETNPVLLEAAVLPDNLEMGKQLSGLEDLIIPGAEARNKQLREIEQLLQEVPIPPDQQQIMQAAHNAAVAATNAQMTGGTPPPPPQIQDLGTSSVPVDPIYDYHKYEFEECQSWLNSEDRVEQEKKGNKAGIENVRLHGIEHFKLIPTQAPEPVPQPVAPGENKPPEGNQDEAPAP